MSLKKLVRAQRTKCLEEAWVKFVSHNDGAHLVVATVRGGIDYWPSSDLLILQPYPRESAG